MWVEQQSDDGNKMLVELLTQDVASLAVGSHVVLFAGASNVDSQASFRRLRWCLLDPEAAEADEECDTSVLKRTNSGGMGKTNSGGMTKQLSGGMVAKLSSQLEKGGRFTPDAKRGTGGPPMHLFNERSAREAAELGDFWFGAKARIEVLVTSKCGILHCTLEAFRCWPLGDVRESVARALQVPSHELKISFLDGDSRIAVKDKTMLGDVVGKAATATFEAFWAKPQRRARSDILARARRNYECPDTKCVLMPKDLVYISKHTTDGWALGYHTNTDEPCFYFPAESVRVLPFSEVALRVTAFNGRHCSVQVPRWWTVKDLQVEIHTRTSIPVADQKLVANKVDLCADALVGDIFFPESSVDVRVMRSQQPGQQPEVVAVQDEVPPEEHEDEDVARPHQVTREYTPNSDAELLLRMGDIVMVVEEEASGWFGGYAFNDQEKRAKWFPGCCVQPIAQ